VDLKIGSNVVDAEFGGLSVHQSLYGVPSVEMAFEPLFTSKMPVSV
jgi:hypothetical protein